LRVKLIQQKKCWSKIFENETDWTEIVQYENIESEIYSIENIRILKLRANSIQHKNHVPKVENSIDSIKINALPKNESETDSTENSLIQKIEIYLAQKSIKSKMRV
jgi:hypothetical protein